MVLVIFLTEYYAEPLVGELNMVPLDTVDKSPSLV
jgi:hypothetical protein